VESYSLAKIPLQPDSDKGRNQILSSFGNDSPEARSPSLLPSLPVLRSFSYRGLRADRSVWLAISGIKLSSSIVEALVIDDAHPDFPMQPDIQHQMELSDEKRTELKRECLSILQACGAEVQNAFWNTPAWLDSVLNNATRIQ
jgi:hypothetical protein